MFQFSRIFSNLESKCLQDSYVLIFWSIQKLKNTKKCLEILEISRKLKKSTNVLENFMNFFLEFSQNNFEKVNVFSNSVLDNSMDRGRSTNRPVFPTHINLNLQALPGN